MLRSVTVPLLFFLLSLFFSFFSFSFSSFFHISRSSRSPLSYLLRLDPMFVPLRSDLRFQKLATSPAAK